MSAIERAKNVILGESRMLEQLAGQVDEQFEKVTALLANCRGHVVVSGVGTSGIIARRFAHLLANVDCPSLFLHAGDSLHGSSGALRVEDVLVLLSKSGETKETLELAQIIFRRGTPIVTLTAKPDSTLGKLSTFVLRVETANEVDPYDGLMSVGSTLAMGAMCDALVFAVMDARQASKDRFLQGHPGGVIATLKADEK